MFVHGSIERLIADTPVDAAIGINDLRVGNFGVINPVPLEMNVSTKPVMDNH